MIFRAMYKDLILIRAWPPNSSGTLNNLILSLHFLSDEMYILLDLVNTIRLEWNAPEKLL